MGIFNILVLGVQLWLWLILIAGMLFLVFVIFFMSSATKNPIEVIKGFIYRKRIPEKTIKVVIHYKTGFYNVFWRLIPERKFFKIQKLIYNYDPKEVKKPKYYFEKDPPKPIKDDYGDYEYKQEAVIKQKKEKFPEIHYFHNIPSPIRFDFDDGTVKFSSSSLKDIKENDLVEKLLRLNAQKGMMMIMLLLIIINAGISLFLLAKEMGWLPT